jgi:hypothetical protein
MMHDALAVIANKAKQSGKLRQCCRHFKESIAVIANEVKQSSKTKMLFFNHLDCHVG